MQVYLRTSTESPMNPVLESRLSSLREAALETKTVTGATHAFYRYPARFSPTFASAAINEFSEPGDIVLDPFMGGGTTLVEAFRLGRVPVGGDINELAVFLTRVKTSLLTIRQRRTVSAWCADIVPELKFNTALAQGYESDDDARMRNLSLCRARPIKKLLALAIESLEDVPNGTTRRFIRCALLSTGQWALNGRREAPSCEDFRNALQFRIERMLRDLEAFSTSLHGVDTYAPVIARSSADRTDALPYFAAGRKADLVITSPPYPGIHMLYHRWQVDGRKETPAPYWISQTRDGKGSAYYNLGDRRDKSGSEYFANLRGSLQSIRKVMRGGGRIVQMLAFGNPDRDLPRYLSEMSLLGFEELTSAHTTDLSSQGRIWRTVPNRAWHATSKGPTASSREVVLVHVAT